jgi:hypothetical protein
LNSEESAPHFKRKYSLAAFEATLLIVFVVLFLPSSASFRGAGTSIASDIHSLMWRIIFYRDGTIGLDLNLYALAYFQYVFLKYLLIFQVNKYYRLRTTRKRVVVVAILSELQWFVMFDVPNIIRFILEGGDWTVAQWILPIPVVLMACILLLVFVPRPESDPIWIDKEEKKSWWT